MFMSFLRLLAALRSRKRSGRLAKSTQRLAVELLEDRRLMSGTPQLLRDINPGPTGSSPARFVDVNGITFFNADDGTHGQELWRTDGSCAGTILVSDLPKGPDDLTNVSGTLFFNGFDATHGAELWRSDGSSAGTTLVSDINPGGSWSLPDSIVNLNGTLFFQANDLTHGQELWRSDGSSAGTTLVKDTFPGGPNNYSNPPRELTNVSGTLFFSGDDGTYGAALWRSDGSCTGTILVSDVPLTELTNANGTLFFDGRDAAHGAELWRSDGSSAGTTLVSDISPGASDGIKNERSDLTNVGGTLFFRANDPTHGIELWRSDGTSAGTTLVKDISPGGAAGNPLYLTNANGTLFFAAANVRYLWRSDGSSAGTTLVTDIIIGSTGLVNVNGMLVFQATDDPHGSELWQSDGTSGGTLLLADVNPGTASSEPLGLANINGVLYFSADDGSTGREPWVLLQRRPVANDDTGYSVNEDTTLSVPAGIRFHVSVDTSSVTGTGDIDMQLNAAGFGAQAATVTISSFTAGTGSAGSVVSVTGSVSGTLPGNVTFMNLFGDNELLQHFTFGDQVQFDMTFSGPAVENVMPTNFGSLASLQFLDSASNQVLTSSSGLDTISFNIDGGLGTITVNPPNFPGFGGASAFALESGVLSNDIDPDGNPLTAILFSSPAHGTVTLQGNGAFFYTPSANFNGVDTFTYKANDGALDSNLATVAIMVNAVNDPPVATNDLYNISQHGTLIVNSPGVLANDTDVDPGTGQFETLTAILVSQTVHRTLTLNSNGSFSYAGDPNFAGTDSFTYKVDDGGTGSHVSNTATVFIVVTPNAAPVANNDNYSVFEDHTLSVSSGVLANDTDVDPGLGQPETLTAILVTGAGHGTVALSSNGSFTYIGSQDFNGTDSFTYKVDDGGTGSHVSNTATVFIVVTPNAAPVANNDTYGVNEDTTLTVNAPGVLANDTDVDPSLGQPETLSVVLIRSPLDGALTLNSDGSFSYIGSQDFHGTDSFAYWVDDGGTGLHVSNIATATVVVNFVNQPPVAKNDSYLGTAGQTLVISAPGVLANDTDSEGDTLTVQSFGIAANGSVSSLGAGGFTYVPSAGFVGTDSFIYKVSDGQANGAGTVFITVRLNHPPVANSDSYRVASNGTLNVFAPGVLANDTDPDGDSLTAGGVFSNPSNGTVTPTGGGGFSYVPSAGFAGTDSFIYNISDGRGGAASATVFIIVGAANQPPVANADTYTIPSGITLDVPAPGVLANDTDPDNDTVTMQAIFTAGHGNVSQTGGGGFSYTPSTGFAGTDSFTYKVSDGVDGSFGTVTIVVGTANQPPLANSDSYTVTENATLNVSGPGVLANDIDPAGAALMAQLTSGPVHGGLSLNPGGAFTYTPSTDYIGADSFTYKPNDGTLAGNTATVTISVNPTGSLNGSNNLNAAGATLTIGSDNSSGNFSGSVSGTGTIIKTGSGTQTLSNATIGTDPNHPINIVVNEGTLLVESNLSGYVIITVNSGATLAGVANIPAGVLIINNGGTLSPGHSPGLFTAASADFSAGGTLDIQVEGYATPGMDYDRLDLGAGTLTLGGALGLPSQLLLDLAGLSASGTATGIVLYGAHVGTFTTVTTIHNSHGFVPTLTYGTASLDVHLEASPEANNDAYAVMSGQTLTITSPGVLANDTDVDGDTLTLQSFSGPPNGSVVSLGGGGFTYAPFAGFSGTDSFTYKLSDGQTSVNGTVFVTVNPVTPPLHLLRDINPNAAASDPASFVAVNGTTFFTTDDGTHGDELWRSDGTCAGTTLVSDINPGAPKSLPLELTNVNGTLFFSYLESSHGRELWRSDGTSAGTTLVSDIDPGSSGAYPMSFVNRSGTLFFQANDLTHGQELWRSDGSSAGTTLVKDISPGGADGFLQYLINGNGTLYFSADDGTHGRELWRSDGTSAGTTLVLDISPGASSGYPNSFTNVNGTLFFDAADATHGHELWRSDGACAGTTLVKDIVAGTPDGIRNRQGLLTNVGGTLFFTASDSAHGLELWQSDGSSSGTTLVRDIAPGGPDGSPQYLINGNGTLFFAVSDGTTGRELWRSDGTCVGTILVSDIRPGSVGAAPVSLTSVNGTLFFAADDGTHGGELWQSDGSSAGTVLVQDMRPGTMGSAPLRLANINGVLYLSADDGVHGAEPWLLSTVVNHPPVTNNDFYAILIGATLTVANPGVLANDTDADGDTLTFQSFSSASHGSVSSLGTGGFVYTPSAGFSGQDSFTYAVSDGQLSATGTVFVIVNAVRPRAQLLRDINPGPAPSGSVLFLDVNGTTFFAASDATHGYELWRTDGSCGGTTLVNDIAPGASGSYIGTLTNVNGTLFFVANEGTHGYELWRSDGTSAGTAIVEDINPGVVSSAPEELNNFNGTLFFVADDGTHRPELWRSNGSSDGTTLVNDFSTSTIGSPPPHFLTNVNGTMFFSASSATNGHELWRTDGISAGTTLVNAIYPTSDLYFLTNVNGMLFFDTDDGTHGSELWRSDGSSAGTTLVKDIVTGSGSAIPQDLTNVNGTLFFNATDGTHGFELWRSDGSGAGTTLVKDIFAGSSDGVADSLTNVNGTLFFEATDGTSGFELWRSDGSSAGTTLVSDIFPSGLINVNGTLFFGAYDGTHGTELWQSDGTSGGTLLVDDIQLGPASSFPQQLANNNGTLYFDANDGSTGFEPWVLSTRINQPPVANNDSYVVTSGQTLPIVNPGVLANDTDADGDTLTAILVAGAAHGTATLAANGSFTYTPSASFIGADSFTYKPNDGSLDGSLATVTISVNPTGSLNGSNNLNVAGATLTIGSDNSSGSFSGSVSGTGTIVKTGSGTQTLSNATIGTDPNHPINIVVNEGTLLVESNLSGYVIITVNSGATLAGVANIPAGVLIINNGGTLSPGHSPGLFAAASADFSGGGTLDIQVEGYATPGMDYDRLDLGAGTLTLGGALGLPSQLLLDLAGLSASGTATGIVLYGAHVGTFTTVTTIHNPHGFVPTLTYGATSLDVHLEASPEANNDAYAITSGQTLTITSPGVLANDTDVDGDTLTLQSFSGPVNGNVVSLGGGGFTYAPFPGFSGTDAFTYSVSDGQTSVTGTVLITVIPVTSPLHLLRDINPNAAASEPGSFVTVNGTTFFTANDGTHGQELWRSDGSCAGTTLVLDINGGAAGSLPDYLTNVNGTLFFRADDGSHGSELWRSDGTSAGTTLVGDINAGAANSTPMTLSNVNGTLFFRANDGSHGSELWRSDGTSAGTTLVSDINGGAGDSSPFDLSNVNGTLFFNANDGSHGDELWRSDGTSAGTTLVSDINGGAAGANPFSLSNVNGTLFFIATDGMHDYEVWRSNGASAGTTLVSDTNGGADSGTIDLRNVNGTLFFRANDGSHGSELWRSDGTSAGTTLVRDINGGIASAIPQVLTNVNGTLFFSANDGTHGLELWQSDGTSAGTTLVSDVNPASSGAIPQFLTNVNGTLFFTANDGTHGLELWQSDGTSAGTTLVSDINPGSSGALPGGLTNSNGTLFFGANDGTTGREPWVLSPPSNHPPVANNDAYAVTSGQTLTITSPGVLANDTDVDGDTLTLQSFSGPVNGNVVSLGGGGFTYTPFAGFSGTDSFTYSVSDGQTSVTGTVTITVIPVTPPAHLLRDINPNAAASSPASFVAVNGTTFFTAYDGTHGQELWRTDGSCAGTTIVRDILAGSASSFPHNLSNVNGTLFFGADDGSHGSELWRSDGTCVGTTLVLDINGGAANSYPVTLSNVNGTLFFRANDGSHGSELWRSDGTSAGTTLVSDINGGAGSSYPSDLSNVNGTLFFNANDGSHGSELWRSDGTSSGTTLVLDINAGAPGSGPFSFTNVNGTLFFSANDGTHGIELWRSQGTSSGTTLVLDINVGAGAAPVELPTGGASSSPADLRNLNGTLFFRANDGSHGSELWRSDGSSAGTTLVSDINGGGSSADPQFMTNINGTLFFRATDGPDGTHGLELWRSDGTSAGTTLVNDVNPGSSGASPFYLTNVNGTLFFSANDGVHGSELWQSDGTSAGTTLVGDINPGSSGADLHSLTNMGGTLFFAANDGTTGREPWVLILRNNHPPVANNDHFSVFENQTLQSGAPGVLTNDADADGDTLHALLISVGGTAHGSLTLNDDGSFFYVPVANYPGTDSFTYRANDGLANSNVATVTITVIPVDQPPVAGNDTFSVFENMTLSVAVSGVLGNDSDIDSPILTARLASVPVHGNVAMNVDGSFSYTPGANYNGTDSFTYQANDGLRNSNVATVTIIVDPVNQAPVANNDFRSVFENQTLIVPATGVLANDTDVDSPTLTAMLFDNPAHGTVTLSGNGAFIYAPDAFYYGTDSFTYKANDGLLNSSLATVSITVFHVDQAPLANNDSYTLFEDFTLTAAGPGVLANDTDIDSPILTARLASLPLHGSVSFNSNGAYTYVPNALFSGIDSFTYDANDGLLNSNLATVTITVMAVNHAPVAGNESYKIFEDLTLNVTAPGVLRNDSDLDGDALTSILVAGPAHGTLTLRSNGSFTYTPATHFSGADSFTYRANDGAQNSTPATVSLSVIFVNHAPTANNDTYRVHEESSLVVPVASGVLANDTDIENSALSALLATGPAHGTLALNANGSFTYTPSSGFFGTDTFRYRANDGSTNSTTATVTLTVTDVSGMVSAVPSALTDNHDGTFTGIITITNITPATDINGPLQVVLTNLTPGVTLQNKTGDTPAGNPYITIPAGSLLGGKLGHGQSVQVTVVFDDPMMLSISYVSKTLSGAF